MITSDPFTIGNTVIQDTSSPLYIPPTGTYQNDAGQIVPKTLTNTPAYISGENPTAPNSSVFSIGSTTGDTGLLSVSQKTLKSIWDGTTLEDIIFIVVGIILIIAGVFGFDSTRSVITQSGKIAAKTTELTA